MGDQISADLPAPILLLIDRPNIENLVIGPPLDALRTMAATPESTREYGGRVEFVFDGYESDPRELYSIQEVRKFVKALTEKFPYWFHFCSKSGDSLWVIIQCLIPVGLVTVVNGVASSAIDSEAWNNKTLELFSAMNGLYHHHGLTMKENSDTTQEVLKYVRQFMRT